MSDYKPTNDIANDGSLSGALLQFIRAIMMETDDMLPATVVSYDDATNRAVVKPLIMMGTTDGTKISRAEIPNVPVFRFGGGGFFIRFPIKPGDFGWVKSNDRDISLMMQRGGLEDWPNTERLHSFSDAMFFPDTLKGWLISGENADAMVIQSMSGNVCVALHDDKLTMTAPELDVNIPQTNWNGQFTLDGTTVNNHTHGGVQNGDGQTAPFGG